MNLIKAESIFLLFDSEGKEINYTYDAERGRYISAASPEMLLQNAAAVYAINLYSLCVTNPLAAAFAAYTVLPSIEFYYDGKMSFWERWGAQIIITIVGVVLTAVACAFSGPCGGGATAASVMATLENIAVTTLVGTAVTLAVGGTIAGIQSALNGSGFWEGFAKSVQENLVDALVTSFAFAAVSVAACNAIKHFQCFKEGTLVETEEGLKPIEEIKAGDKVLAYDEQTGEQAYKKVVRLFRNETKYWCTVCIKPEDGQEVCKIISTPGHKYYLPDNTEKRDIGKQIEHIGYADLSEKWVSAESLKNGDRVLLFDGSYGIVQSVKVKQLDVPETTYNFEVEDYHTYYVGVQGVLVHNANCGVGGHGWEGDADWRANVKTVREGGDIMEMKGGIPTQSQAEKLVIQSKGTLIRAEGAHLPPNPHTFPHINYLTYSGNKGMIRLDSVVPKIY